MTPGEIDALIAEHVFGKQVTKEENLDEDGFNDYDDFYHTDGSSYSLKDRVPDYSTSIADAWSVVERMRGKYKFTIYSGDEEFLMEGVLIQKNPNGEEISVPGVFIPRAICLAALKSLGISCD